MSYESSIPIQSNFMPTFKLGAKQCFHTRPAQPVEPVGPRPGMEGGIFK